MKINPYFLLLFTTFCIYSCSSEEDSISNLLDSSNSTDQTNTSNNSSTNNIDSSNSTDQTNTSNNTNTNNTDSQQVINSDFECGNGYFYNLRPEPVNSDDTFRYYEYAWQSDPPICINIYEAELLEGRDEKLTLSMDWLGINLPNIIPINVFYIDQFNASEASKLEHDTDFCNLIREPNELNQCISESTDSWGDRSYGGGVYGKYLHKGADLMMYDDAFVQDEGEDYGLIYLAHEYFHTFQTGHLFYFEDTQQFGIRILDDENGVPLPFLPIWIGEGGANFASLTLMAKQNLDFNHYDQAERFLNQARRALEGSGSSFSLRDFENDNIRNNDEYYAYDGGFMAHVYLWSLNEDNFKKLMVDFYTVFAEKYKINPVDGWKDAFEETFEISLEDFYRDFDAFMRQDKESQISIIKNSDAWVNASWD